jgi:hypothetical protein
MKRFRSLFRGLALGLSLSVLNLVGLFLTLLLLGGIGEWTRMQFVGIFGLFEIATGIAFIVCPNVWRLPVFEAETSDRTSIRLTASTLFIPHWAGGAKCIAGIFMVGAAFNTEGVSLASAGLVPFVAMTAVFTVAVSIAVARWGVAKPELDVVHFVVKRPSRKDIALPGISITAATIQIILGTFTLPVIKLVSPEAFFGDAFAATPEALAWTAAGTSVATLVALWAWRGRISMDAQREQQELAEEPA